MSPKFMVLDGKTGEEYDRLSQVPVFSPTHGHLAYVARRANKSFVVVDGRPGPEFEEIQDDVVPVLRNSGNLDVYEVHLPVFSPDGKHLAYAARSNWKWRLVLDGKDGPEHEGIDSAPIFSSDGKLVAYLATGHTDLDYYNQLVVIDVASSGRRG